MGDKVKKNHEELRDEQLKKATDLLQQLLIDGQYGTIEFTVKNGIITNSAKRITETNWC